MSDRIAALQMLWNQGPDALALVRDGLIVDANDRFLRWSGGVVGSTLSDRFSSVAESGRHVVCATGDDPRRVLERESMPVDGELWLERLRDVSDDWRRRRELAQKRAALEGSLNGYDIVDASGRIIYANEAYIKMWGYDALDQVIGMSPADHCADPDTPARIIEALQRDGRTTIEFKGLRRDGSTFDVLMAAQVSTDAAGNTVFVGTSLDLSEYKRLQNELFHLQKLESIGVLAASVAHDFNNMLSPILGFAELMLGDETIADHHRHGLEQIQIAGQHSRELTARLLAFSRRQVLEPRPTDLGDAVEGIEGLIRQLLREDIELSVFRSHESCTVMVDPGQLQQVVLNLTNNAQDAMPTGGKLTIEVGVREFDEAYCRQHAFASHGRFGELLVSDTGHGMDPDTRDRLFEPFFTTKGRLGTGLGLASVHGIVKQHGGNIWVYSEVGVGTTFKIYWPLTDQAVEPGTGVARAVSAEMGAMILVAEDNDLVRNVVKSVLTSAGFEVYAAESGAEAAAWLESSDRALDMLVTDVVMPDSNGRRLAELAEAYHPGLRVLYMSGYTDNVVVHNGFLDPGIEFLQKPFSASELVQRVRMILG